MDVPAIHLEQKDYYYWKSADEGMDCQDLRHCSQNYCGWKGREEKVAEEAFAANY